VDSVRKSGLSAKKKYQLIEYFMDPAVKPQDDEVRECRRMTKLENVAG